MIYIWTLTVIKNVGFFLLLFQSSMSCLRVVASKSDRVCLNKNCATFQAVETKQKLAKGEILKIFKGGVPGWVHWTKTTSNMKLSVISHLLVYYLFQVSAVTREYYIGINEIDWNYAPGTKNILTGKPFSEDE